MRILHAIHDFLPRHRAGSEIYVFQLAREQARRHHVTVLAAEYDPARAHGSLHWRLHEDLPVVELINNWAFATFAETYASPALNTTLTHVLRAVDPDVLHVHNLLNLSLDLPALARARGIPTVATLHDYTLVCPSGGQRVHVAERHVCEVIDPDRCRRCFGESPFAAQMAFVRATPSAWRGGAARLARALERGAPWLAGRARRALVRAAGDTITADHIRARLERARRVFDDVAAFVAPSAALAAEYRRLGLPADKIRVSDNGLARFDAAPRTTSDRLRIGFVGTLVWHKGPHVLVEAARALRPGTFEVKIFGDPDTFPPYVATLREAARGLDVRFMGAFDNARAPEVYQAIDVLVVPSLWPENSPVVIHEAYVAGVPVVAARQGGVPELVAHGRNGLLYDPHSAAELARALQRLIDDRDTLARLAAALPVVKRIEEDAQGWDTIYGAVADAP